MKLSKDDIKLFEEYRHLSETFCDFELYVTNIWDVTVYILSYETNDSPKNGMLWINKTQYLYMKRKIIINKLNK